MLSHRLRRAAGAVPALWSVPGVQPTNRYNLNNPDCWDRSSSSATDLSGSVTGSFVNGPILTTGNGVINDPLFAIFDAPSSQYFLCPTLDARTIPLRLAVEVIAENTPSIPLLTRSNSNRGIALRSNGLTIFGIAEYFTTITATPSGINHWVFYVDSTVYRIYRNGVQVGSTAITSFRTSGSTSAGFYFNISQNNNGVINAYYGGEFSYWAYYDNLTLSSTDINNKYLAAKAAIGVLN